MRVIFFFIMFCIGSSAYAVKVHDLYEAIIPVASQSVQDRAEAIPKALEQVLIKNSGNLDIIKNSQIKASLRHADNLVQEYSYQPSAANSAFPYLLIIKFDRTGVSQLLKHADQPMWGSNRPLILVWLVLSTSAQNAEIVSADSASPIFNLMKQQAAQNGMPMIFPVMDMDELNQISIQDITTMSLANIMHVSRRYAPDALLVGYWVTIGQGLQSQWKFVQGGAEQDWTITGSHPGEIVTTLFTYLQTTLTHRYREKTTSASAQPIEILVTLQVNGITQSQDLTLLLRSLKQVTEVEDVQVIQVSHNTVWLEVDVHAMLESFIENVALIPHLALESKEDNNTLVYTWDHEGR